MPVVARINRATTWKGMSVVWDPQYVVKTGTPRPAAFATVSRTSRLLPIPGGPTTVTTHPAPPTDFIE